MREYLVHVLALPVFYGDREGQSEKIPNHEYLVGDICKFKLAACRLMAAMIFRGVLD